jgi:hypothetical protein
MNLAMRDASYGTKQNNVTILFRKLPRNFCAEKDDRPAKLQRY